MAEQSTHNPLYQQIKQDILSQIAEGLLLPGDKLPTEAEMVRRYHVSRITISKALTDLKNEGLVIRYPSRGTFLAQELPQSVLQANSAPVAAAADPVPSVLTEVACIIPSVSDMFAVQLIAGLHSVLPESSYICHIFQSRTPRIENYILKHCLENGISGIVLFPQDQPFFSNELLSMQLQKYPLVLLDRYLPRLDTSYVISDNKEAGELCLRHLSQLGHTRIAFATSSARNTHSVRYRINGILDAGRILGFDSDSIRILDNFDRSHDYSYYAHQINDLVYNEGTTAFIASESLLCSFFYNLLQHLKLKVPEQISLISFDSPNASNQASDFFTHINQSEYTMGREAGLILRRCIENNNTDVQHKIITPTLEINDSTGFVRR